MEKGVKFCPLKFAGMEWGVLPTRSAIGTECEGENCAWYLEGTKCCAIYLIGDRIPPIQGELRRIAKAK